MSGWKRLGYTAAGHATWTHSAERLSGNASSRANHINRCIYGLLPTPIKTLYACEVDLLLMLMFRRKGGISSRKLCGVQSRFAAIEPSSAHRSSGQQPRIAQLMELHLLGCLGQDWRRCGEYQRTVKRGGYGALKPGTTKLDPIQRAPPSRPCETVAHNTSQLTAPVRQST